MRGVTELKPCERQCISTKKRVTNPIRYRMHRIVMWNTRTFLCTSCRACDTCDRVECFEHENSTARTTERWRYVNQSGIAHMPNLFVIHLRCRSQTKRDEIHSSVVMVQARVRVFSSLTIFPWQWFCFAVRPNQWQTNRKQIEWKFPRI